MYEARAGEATSLPVPSRTEGLSTAPNVHAHVAGEAAQPHEHPASGLVADASTPSSRGRRVFLTGVANVTLAIGFGLLLCAAMHLRGNVTGWRSGVLWGLAGYIVFFVAPSLGLPPELPGTAAAPLAQRQHWWLEAVVASGIGLSLLCFAPRWYGKLAGLVSLLAPHLLGAPHLQNAASAAPAQIADAFVGATALANAVMWISLGTLVGVFYCKSFVSRPLSDTLAAPVHVA